MMLVSIVLAYIFTLKLCVQKNMQCHAHFKVCSSFHLCFVLFAQRSDRMLLSMHKMYNLHESNVFDILFVDKGLITLTFSYMKSFFMISYMKTTLFFYISHVCLQLGLACNPSITCIIFIQHPTCCFTLVQACVNVMFVYMLLDCMQEILLDFLEYFIVDWENIQMINGELQEFV